MLYGEHFTIYTNFKYNNSKLTKPQLICFTVFIAANNSTFYDNNNIFSQLLSLTNLICQNDRKHIFVCAFAGLRVPDLFVL